MIVNDDSSNVNKLETSLINDARVIIYDQHMFMKLKIFGQMTVPFPDLSFHILSIKANLCPR